jgi:hypothetical protein
MFRLSRKKIASRMAERVEAEAVECRTDDEGGARRQSRAEWLRKVSSGLAAVVGGGIAVAISGNKEAKAVTGDSVILGKSGDPSIVGPPPNLAEDATEVQFDNTALSPGVVFLAQADNTYTPAAANAPGEFPAALAGWTSARPDIANGVYGRTELTGGAGVVGWGVGPASRGVFGQSFDRLGVGGAFVGPNRAPLNLRPENVGTPPPTGQAGDLYVTINVDNFAELWFHTGLAWRRVALI